MQLLHPLLQRTPGTPRRARDAEPRTPWFGVPLAFAFSDAAGGAAFGSLDTESTWRQHGLRCLVPLSRKPQAAEALVVAREAASQVSPTAAMVLPAKQLLQRQCRRARATAAKPQNKSQSLLVALLALVPAPPVPVQRDARSSRAARVLARDRWLAAHLRTYSACPGFTAGAPAGGYAKAGATGPELARRCFTTSPLSRTGHRAQQRCRCGANCRSS